MVDAADLKSASRKGVGVRVPSWAPHSGPALEEQVAHRHREVGQYRDSVQVVRLREDRCLM